MDISRAKDILDYWFSKGRYAPDYDKWFMKSQDYDEEITEKFGDLLKEAEEGWGFGWLHTKDSYVAYIILLDQFSRNMFRDTAKAFSQDKKAQSLAQHAIKQNYFSNFSNNEIFFSLIPLLHSENINDHKIAHKNCEKYLKQEANYDQIKQSWNDHTKAINNFGRYPHRNKILGRSSTKEEKLFLTQPNSSW